MGGKVQLENISHFFPLFFKLPGFLKEKKNLLFK